MAGQPPFTPRKKNALSEYKLRLTAPKENGMTRNPTLSVSVVKNQLHMDVYTNVPQEPNNGRITAKMSSRGYRAVMELVKAFAEGRMTKAVVFDCDGHTFYPGKRSDKKTLNYIQVGINKDGAIYIAVRADKHKDIQFAFIDEEYHRFRYADGSEFPMSEASKLYALGWVGLLNDLSSEILNSEYVEPEPRPDNGNNGWKNNNGGNNNWKNNGNKGSGSSWGDKSGGGDSGWGDSSGGEGSGDGDFPENW